MQNNRKKMLILNTGGTFNKVYNQIKGKLVVPKNDIAVERILDAAKVGDICLKGMIYKDSLEMTSQDRKLLLNYIQWSKYEKIILIHGTDTMDKTAEFLSKNIKDKQIVITGSMVPFSINSIEATSNLMQAVGFLQTKQKENIYIAMHGHVMKYNKIFKNRKLGLFECR